VGGRVIVRTPDSSAGAAADAAVELFSIKIDSNGAYSWEAIKATVTDSNGNFFLDSLDSGYYSLTFCLDSLKAFSGYITFSPGDSSLLLDSVPLQNTQNITGTIQDTLDTPYPGTGGDALP
jgi:hypothetical protein